MECRERLLRSRDQVLVQLWLFLVFNNFIQHIIIVSQLGRLTHQILLHEKWRLDRCVATRDKESYAIVDQCLIQQDAWAGQVICPVACHILSSFKLDGSEHLQQLEMRAKTVGAILCCEGTWFAPDCDSLIIFLI